MPQKKTLKPKTAQTADKAKKMVKQEIKRVEKETQKAVKTVVKTAQSLPKTVKNYSVKQAKFDVKRLILEARDLILRPRKLFESITPNNDFDEPIIKAAFYGFLGALVSTLIGFFSGHGLESLTKLIYVPVITILMTFGFAGILLFIGYLSKGRMDFESAVKAVSSKIFIYPVAIILGTLSFSYQLLVFTTVLVDLFVVYLAYSMVVYCLNADLKRARIIFGVLAALMIVFYLSAYSTPWFMARNFEVAMTYHLQQTLGMNIDMDSLRNIMQ